MTAQATVDVLFVNASVYTVDDVRSTAEAVGVVGNRIVFVGSNSDATYLCGPATRVIDCGGKTLLPGFIDSHFHLLMGSEKLEDLDLDSAYTRADLIQQIGDWVKLQPDLAWIEGVSAHYAAFAGDESPRRLLDRLSPDRPVFISSFDRHTGWANSLALEMGGILHGADLPAGNVIVMEPDGKTASGELREAAAMDPVRNLIPKPDANRHKALIRKGMALAASYGITSVHNMDGNDYQLGLYTDLESAGEMTLRIYVPWDIKPDTPIEAIARAAEWKKRPQGEYVRTGSVKVFMDGVLESFTALMVDDYPEHPGNQGEALHTPERFNQIAETADKYGLQVIVHCCGDGAVQRTLDGYAYAQEANGVRDSRHRVEHIEVIYPTDIGRFKQLGVIGSMQPYHYPPFVTPDDTWPNHAGRERWKYSFAWKTLREAGMRHAFGSDWPVVSMDPVLGFWSAMNRKPMQPGDPEQAQTLDQVIAGYTRDGAYAEFMEHEKGQIAPGFLADIVVLSENIFAVPADDFRRVVVDYTMCNGRIVYTRNAQ